MKIFVLLAVLAVSYADLAPLLTDNEPIPGSYIVVLEDGVNVDEFASSLQMTAAANDVKTMEIKWKYSFGLALRRFPDRLVNLLQGLKGVKYVEQDGVVHALQGVGSWGLDRIDQRSPYLNDNYIFTSTGSGIPVWVIDTGINYNHIDIEGRAELFFDYQGGDGKDCQGHGSHCAGTVAGLTYGVAKGAHLYSCRILDCYGSGYASDSIKATEPEWCVVYEYNMVKMVVEKLTNTEVLDEYDYSPTRRGALELITASGMAPGVVSMSIGGSASSAEDTAVANAVAAGYVVSVAAGNENSDACNGSPARAPEAITVGATELTLAGNLIKDIRASFSNFGSCLDIFAPGFRITSIGHINSFDTNSKSGTSMACPHVSGAAAKIFENNPSWTPAQVEAEMMGHATANVVGDAGTGSPNLLLFSA